MLVVPKIRIKGYDVRSFLYDSAMLCDDRLTESSSVAVFKGRLKIHLFNSYFSPVFPVFVIVYIITLCCLNLGLYLFQCVFYP